VGKSSIVMRFVHGHWNPCLTSTIGAAFTTKTVRYDKDTVRWELWDTAGQEQYNSLVPMYYRGAMGAVLVYDITSVASFGRLQRWVTELKNSGPPNLVIALAGNKADLSEHRQVEKQSADDYAKQIGALCMETSAKSALNIDTLFTQLWRSIRESTPSPSEGTVTSLDGAPSDTIRDLRLPPRRRDEKCCTLL